MLTTTRPERRAHVARMRHSFALEGQHPDPFDFALQVAYTNGTVSLADMLAHATAYARLFSNTQAMRLPVAA